MSDPITKEDLHDFGDQFLEKLQDKLALAVLPIESKLDNLDAVVKGHLADHKETLDPQLYRNKGRLSQIFWTSTGAFGVLGLWETVKAWGGIIRGVK